MGMYRATVAARAGVNTANTVYFQLKNVTTERLYIVEFGITIAVAPTTAPQFALTRSSTTGTSSTTQLGTASDPADTAATGTLDSAWSSAPTFATGGPHLWSAAMPVTAGSGWAWVAPNDRARIVVPTSGGVCLANLVASGATTGSFNFYIAWEE
jgi:hypothetical protein